MLRRLCLVAVTLLSLASAARAEGTVPVSALRLDIRTGATFGQASGPIQELGVSFRYRFLQAGITGRGATGIDRDHRLGGSLDAGLASESERVRFDLVGRLGIQRHREVNAYGQLFCVECLEEDLYPGVEVTLPYAGLRTDLLFRIARTRVMRVWLGAWAAWDTDLDRRSVTYDGELDGERVVREEPVGWSRGSLGLEVSFAFDVGTARQPASAARRSTTRAPRPATRLLAPVP